jgi:transcriptional regulator with XRE-family HTH domain
MDLKTLRHRARLNQTELAERVGCGQSFISDLETGRAVLKDVSYALVLRLARELHVKPADLVPDATTTMSKRPKRKPGRRREPSTVAAVE